jgi:hypothetical protein
VPLPKRVIIISWVLASFGGGALANASTILFSNLVQPGNQYGPEGVSIGHTPAFPNAGDYLIYAVPFTPGASAVLTSFEAPLGVVSGANQLQAFLFADEGGAPGSVIESFTLSGLPTVGFPFPLLTIASGLDPLVIGGQQYWFGATGGADTFGEWSLNLFQGNSIDGGASMAVIDGVAQPWIVGPGLRTGALVVSGDVAPEPSYTALFGCILLAGLKFIHYSKSLI